MPALTLEKKLTKAYTWTAAGSVAKNLAGFTISLVLAYLLGPKEYGLLGMAMVFTNILSLLQDCGIGQAVVYYQEERSGLSLYYTAAAIVGGILTLAAFLLAPLFAWFYHQPAITSIVRVLSCTLAMGSLYSVAQGLLVREFDFRVLALVELGSTVTAGITGIICAVLGLGVWALVINVVLSSFLQMVAVCWMVRPTFTLRLDWIKLRNILRWGLPYTGAGVLWQAYENSDYLVVGRMMGQAAVGYYTMAFRTATLVNSRVATIINRVSFPTFSTVQSNYPELVSHWNAITERIGLLVFPLSTMLAVNAHDFLLLLGRKWLPAEVPLQLLCLLGAFKPLISTMTNCMCAVGRTKLSFQFSLTNAILLPLSFIVTCRFYGVVGVAVAWCVVAPVIFAVFLYITVRFVHGSLREYAATLRPGVVISVFCAAAMFAAGLPFEQGLLRLVIRSAAGGAATLAGYWMHQPTRRLIMAHWPAGIARYKPAADAEDVPSAQ